MTAHALDHLVIGAATLAEGLDWAAAAFGVAPAARGRHAAMGTHNALWHLAVPGACDAYLEIIAIDPEAPPPGRPRWFGLDDPAVQAALAAGPRLLTWQVRPGLPLDEAVARLRRGGIEPGAPLAMTRDDLAWRLTVRDDGSMPEGGRFPVLIEWAADAQPPPERLAPGGLALAGLTLGLSEEAGRALALVARGHDIVRCDASPFGALIETPAGPCRVAGLG